MDTGWPWANASQAAVTQRHCAGIGGEISRDVHRRLNVALINYFARIVMQYAADSTPITPPIFRDGDSCALDLARARFTAQLRHPLL